MGARQASNRERKASEGWRHIVSLQEFYEMVKGDEALKEAFVEVMRANEVEAFLSEHDCDTTSDEVAEFLKTVASEDKGLDELDESDLDLVAGGGSGKTT